MSQHEKGFDILQLIKYICFALKSMRNRWFAIVFIKFWETQFAVLNSSVILIKFCICF